MCSPLALARLLGGTRALCAAADLPSTEYHRCRSTACTVLTRTDSSLECRTESSGKCRTGRASEPSNRRCRLAKHRPPVFLLGRQGSENQSHHRGRKNGGFSGKYGSTGQLGICPHEAGLDSWCRPSSWQLGGWHHITSLAIFGRRILRNEDLSGNGFTRIRRVQMCFICKSGHQRGIAH